VLIHYPPFEFRHLCGCDLHPRAHRCRNFNSGSMRTVSRSPHFFRGVHTEHCEPGGKNIDDSLHQGKTRCRQPWIILDNEA
jgi:hypothetical protein